MWKLLLGLITLSLLTFSTSWISRAADDNSSQTADGNCCKVGDKTPPTKLVKEVPKGQLKNPYEDVSKVASEGHKQFMNAGCNGCHGGTGGGGMCPPLDQGVWFFGSKDDTLFRLVTLGSDGLQKEGFKRQRQGAVQGSMPPMGSAIPTSDDLWKIISWLRTIQPPPTKVLHPSPNG